MRPPGASAKWWGVAKLVGRGKRSVIPGAYIDAMLPLGEVEWGARPSQNAAHMVFLLRCLLVLVPLAAAVDSISTGLTMPRPPAPAILFIQSLGLWALLGLMALVPALISGRLLKRRPAAGGAGGADGASGADNWAGGALALLWWMAIPVLAHMRLDSYTGLGGDLSGVLAPRPLAETLGLAVISLALLRWVAPRLARVAPRPLGPVVAAASLFAGALLPVGAELAPGTGGSSARMPTMEREAATPGQPNILLLVWDTTRSGNLTPYGSPRGTTPRLAELAAHSLVFEEARSVSCFTLTSHLSMLTGVYPSHHGASIGRMFYDAQRTPPVTRSLLESGYRTGGFVGTGVLRAETGMDHGFEVFDDRVDPEVCATHAWALVHDAQAVLAHLVPALRSNGRFHVIQDFDRPGEEVLERALAWIEQADERPWFALVNLYDVHWPYLPEEEARGRFVRPYGGSMDGFAFRSDGYPRPPEGVPMGSLLNEADDRHLEDLYDGELWELDRAVGAFIDALDLARSNTAVVVVSDHGEAFGEGGRYEHSDILEAQVRVPFIVYLPRDGTGPRPPAGTRPGRVSGVDVAATLLGLAGLPVPDHMRGLNLSAGELPADRPLLVEDRDKLEVDSMHLAYYRGPWKLVQAGLGDEPAYELFDLGRDAAGLVDVAAEHPQVLADLKAEMDAMRGTWDADGEGGLESILGGRTSNRALQGLGYLGD